MSHCHATAVSTDKVTCNKKTLKQIARWVSLCTQDAIDNIRTNSQRTQVFSSMGAGAKCDPPQIQIAISNTIYDLLARSVLRRLRLLGMNSGIPMEYSAEEFQDGSMKERSAFDDFRVRIPPAFGLLPSIFGLNIATYILCELSRKPYLGSSFYQEQGKSYINAFTRISCMVNPKSRLIG
ncbi:hypothetical protein BYT27DRAFT_7219903 [Phlegmacium glaucopus]|nr:hypothetical protein BYT27DRAFT_7219903 [Phlegmacium glaucopus]